MTSKQRAFLRSLASTEHAIFQIGKGNVGEEAVKQIGNALEARELVKVSVLETSELSAREAAELVAEGTSSEVVATIGNKFILYKESSNKSKRKIDLKNLKLLDK